MSAASAFRSTFLVVAGAAALAGCTSVPPPLQGAWSTLTPREASEQALGTTVRWGGRLVAVEPRDSLTCLRLIAQPLGPNGQPDGSATSLGPFVACREGRFPESSFQPNREVTVTGRIDGFDGTERDARVPRVAADAVLLWPQR